MSKTLKYTSLVIAVALSFTILGQELYAQEGPDQQSPTRVAIVVDLEESFNGAGDVVDQIVESAREFFDELDGFQAITGRQVGQAQRELDLNITEDSSPREIRRFAEEINADVVVVFTVNNLPGNQIRIEADAFGVRGGEIFEARSERISENAGGLIGRFVANVLEEILELL